MPVVDRWHHLAIAGLRIVVGVIFLWAGLEKLLAPEPFSAAGFLQFATGGSLGIGISLILGLLTRFGAAMGTLMMLGFFVAAWEFGIVNQHLTYALVTAFLGYIGAGIYVGLDRQLGERVSPGIRRWLPSGDPQVAAGTAARPSAASAWVQIPIKYQR